MPSGLIGQQPLNFLIREVFNFRQKVRKSGVFMICY
jgi:hypothetical protein